MKGTNTMHINSETMVEALQVYMNRIMIHPPDVVSVRPRRSKPPTFEVIVVERQNNTAQKKQKP